VIRECWLGIALSTVAPAWAADAIPPLNIKPGLWEVTLTVETSGPPPEVLAKLSHEERARFEAMAKQWAAEGPRTTLKRNCLDEKQLHQQLMLTFGGEGQGCRQSVVQASRTKQELRVDCGDGAAPKGGTVSIEAMDPEHVKAASMRFAPDWSGAMKISTATLRWLGTVCEATPQLEAASAPAGADAGYYYKLGKEQADRNELWEALRSLNRAVELDPQRASSYNARGYVYLRLQSFANAAVEFSDAIRLRPDYVNAYQNRAIARRHLGDEEGAAADSRKAAELERRR